MNLIWVSFIGIAAAMWPHSWIVGESCGKAAMPLFTECTDWEWDCYCSNAAYLGTVERCIAKYSLFNSTTMGEAWDRFGLSYCTLHNTELDDQDIWEAEREPTNFSVDPELYWDAYRGQYNNLKQKDTSVYLGLGLIFYWIAIFLIAAIRRAFVHAALRLAENRASMHKPGKWQRMLQRRIAIPALFGGRHMVRLQCFGMSFMLATRFETIVILGYYLLCLIFMLTPYTFMDGDPFFDGSRWKEMMRYSSDRSGILATVNMPLFLLFAMRNNLLIWITGWSFSSFNVYHRAVARICYLLLIIHAVTKHIFSASYGGSLVKYFYPLMYYQYGVAAMGLFAIMIAVGSIRERYYEVFLWTHILCAIAGIVCSIFHLDGIGYREPLYVCLAIWGGDVLLRLLRIFVFNFSVLLPPLAGSQRISFGTIKVYNEELTSITIHFPVRWVVRPGQFVYLHLERWSILGGHPFSVVGKSASGEGLEILCKKRDGLTKKLCNSLVADGCTGTCPVTRPIYIEGPYGVSVPVERYDEALFFAGGIGITGVLGYAEKMSESSSEHPKGVNLIWVVQKREDFAPVVDRVLALSTRPGVKISLYCRAVRIAMANIATPLGSTFERGPKKGHAMYFSNSSETLAYIDESVMEERHATTSSQMGRLANEDLKRAGLFDPVDEKDAERLNKHESTAFARSMFESAKPARTVNDLNPFIDEGRPDISQAIRTTFSASQGSVAVVGCGPGGMMDAVASSVCEHLELVEHGRADYFEEAFGW